LCGSGERQDQRCRGCRRKQETQADTHSREPRRQLALPRAM
jgi:hypothetical protein